MQKALREEQDARFQNQGEVSILRKRMEKVRITPSRCGDSLTYLSHL